MTDIEIIEVLEKGSTKRKRNNAKYSGSNAKRKRTSSGLIEESNSMKGTETEFEEFVIDRTVTPQRKLTIREVEKSEEQNDSSEWRKRLKSTLLGFEPTAEDAKKAKNARFKKVCYNCDGEHNVFDCPHPKDHRRIAMKKKETGDAVRRRQEFYNMKLTNQKETNVKPGELSSRARYALGLGDYDIPEYIYRMRRMGFIKGYPPGWLQKAIKNSDLLKMYSSDVEVTEDQCDEPPELDMSKIIWYPGFNEESSHLNDREAFKVPPKKVFCEGYQKELLDIHKRRQTVMRRRAKKYAKRAKHKKFANDEDDDVIVIGEDEQSGKRDKYVTPGEEECVIIIDGNVKKEEETVAKLPLKHVALGESEFQTIGAPVLKNLKLADVPAIEAFAVGIQPFEARDEDTESKGIFRKLMASLNKVREKVLSADSIDSSEIPKCSESSASINSMKTKRKNRKRKHKKT